MSKMKTKSVRPKMSINHVETGLRAKTYRQKYRVKLAEIAEVTKVNAGNLSHFEAGRRKWTAEFFKTYLDTVDTVFNNFPW